MPARSSVDICLHAVSDSFCNSRRSIESKWRKWENKSLATANAQMHVTSEFLRRTRFDV